MLRGSVATMALGAKLPVVAPPAPAADDAGEDTAAAAEEELDLNDILAEEIAGDVTPEHRRIKRQADEL